MTVYFYKNIYYKKEGNKYYARWERGEWTLTSKVHYDKAAAFGKVVDKNTQPTN